MNDIIDRFRLSLTGWLFGTLAGWGTLLLTLGGFVGLLALSASGSTALPLWLPLIASLAGIAIIGWKGIESLSTRYDLTSERLIVHRGIFVKSIDEIELYRVKDVRLDYSLVNQLAGIGTIGLTSSDATTGGTPLSLTHVGRAKERREMLRGLVEAARQKRRVREIDLLHEDL